MAGLEQATNYSLSGSYVSAGSTKFFGGNLLQVSDSRVAGSIKNRSGNLSFLLGVLNNGSMNFWRIEPGSVTYPKMQPNIYDLKKGKDSLIYSGEWSGFDDPNFYEVMFGKNVYQIINGAVDLNQAQAMDKAKQLLGLIDKKTLIKYFNSFPGDKIKTNGGSVPNFNIAKSSIIL